MYKSAFVAFTALAVAQARLVHMRRQDIAAPSNTLPDIPPRTNWTTDASAALVKREDNWLDPEHCVSFDNCAIVLLRIIAKRMINSLAARSVMRFPVRGSPRLSSQRRSDTSCVFDCGATDDLV